MTGEEGGEAAGTLAEPSRGVTEVSARSGLRPEQGPAHWTARFIRSLVRDLDDAKIRWVVLRNHQDLPDHVGDDVDIVVHPDDEATFDRVIRATVKRSGLFLLHSYSGLEHHTFAVATPELSGRFLLLVDIKWAVAFKGRLMMDAEGVLADRRRSGELWVPTPGIEGYVLLLHMVLKKGELTPRYVQRLAAIEELEPGAVDWVARRQLGKDLAQRLTIVRTRSQLLAIRRPLAGAIDRRHPGNLWRRPIFQVRNRLRQVRLRMDPPGLFVALLGPDGSGKSSTTELLATLLGSQGDVLPVHRVYLGSSQPLLPTRKLVRRLRGSDDPSHKSRPVRDVAPRRLRGALHVTADEILRYWVNVRPHLARHGIVLADRYAYDLFRINNPMVRRRWFRRVATIVIPAPNVTFFLEGDPEVITARKRELTLEETIRQQRAYRGLIDVVPDLRPLDLTTRDDAALQRVAIEILDAYSTRNHGFPADGAVTRS
jgi:thymidylate kinase